MQTKKIRWSRWIGATLVLGGLGLAAAAPASAQTRSRAAAQAATVSARDAAPSSSGAGVVNLNTATADDLERLPGIGPSKAQAILALRQRMGRFQRVEDVLRVRGIGRVTFRHLRPMLSLSGASTYAGPPPRRAAEASATAEAPPRRAAQGGGRAGLR